MWYEGDRWGIHVYEEIPVPEAGDRWQTAAAMTQQLARVFEDGIRQHPADWHMLQRVFVADLDPERLASARAKVAARERAAKKNGARRLAEGVSGAPEVVSQAEAGSPADGGSQTDGGSPIEGGSRVEGGS
jgi:hypothetical protein